MRVQLSPIPKTRVHFGESCDDGDLSPKLEKYYDMRHKFYLKEDTIKTNYRNEDISWRKMNKQLKELANRKKACMNCLENNFDSNMRPIVREVIKKENFFVRLFKVLKAV